MAKWDLSKLPEGRKPLPDEWFAERAQMQERIKELDARMSDDLVKMARLAQHDERMSTGALYGDLADRIEELEAKLAKAVAFLEDQTGAEWPYDEDAKCILTELTGGEDE